MRVLTLRRRCLAAPLAAPVLAGCVSASPDGTRPPTPAERAANCREARHAAEDFARRYPDAPADEVRRQLEELCRAGGTPAPAPVPAPAVSSAGCRYLSADGRSPVPLGRRRPRPERRVPFFAERAGRLPSSGSPVVGGVRLPPGSACARRWATDAPVRDAIRRASRLAAAFARTGLWPVLWATTFDDPDSSMNAMGRPRAAGRLDPGRVMRRVWGRLPARRAALPGAGARVGGRWDG